MRKFLDVVFRVTRLSLVSLFVISFLIAPSTLSLQPRAWPPNPASAKPAARVMVEGTYEERFKSTTPLSSAESSLKIQFQGERWVKMGVNETGRAEFSDLP